MVIGAPHESPLARPGRAVACRLFRPIAPAEQIAVADGVVARVKRFALPPELEEPFGDAALIARIVVDRAPAPGRPADDLDRESLWLVDEAAIAFEALIA